jgi:hypothetical protein
MRGAPMKHSKLSKGESGGELPRDLDPVEIGVHGDEEHSSLLSGQPDLNRIPGS